MYSEFNRKVAVVSGAAQGIGRAIADRLLSVGTRVVSLDRVYNNNEIETTPPCSEYQLRLDVSDGEQVKHVVASIENNLGPIDYLVNVAGILRPGLLTDLSNKDWQETFAVNTTGAFNLCCAVTKYMIERQRGSLVAISSNAASVPRVAMGSYAASKAATTQFMKCLGLELAQYNIRCNIVSPGSTDTSMQQQLCKNTKDIERVITGSLEKYRLGIPLGAIASPQTIANSVIFLLSDQANHITMEDMVVDGGATLGC